MNLTYENLIQLMQLIHNAWTSGNHENDFARNTWYAFKPFYNLRNTLLAAGPGATVSIPFDLAMDINSIVLKHAQP